ncbi:single-stranded DNA-binding protein [Prescottella agglutinans]|uniref:Single-stranded DNA-binding protein n=1 Tax=Prescottella agglutinans TaxID=1644129 RepID=A0ABT6MEX6_9NOCA|nr:single-stranded DNA-binding protein [Prescottella agglutinans]MDH6282871.1 single-strand DNA-binding protein [Prescottella agglutinans]
MALPQIDGTARIVGEPNLKFTPSGKACLELTLAFNERRLNRDTNEWENGDSWWGNYAQYWGPKAEAAAEILRDKMTVLVNGKLRTERWDDQSGQKKSRDRLIINDIAPTIQAERAGGGGGAASSRQQSGNEDPWGAAPQGGYDDGVPF